MDTGDGISASRFSYLVHVSLAPCGWLLVRDRPIRPSSVQELRFDFLTSPSGVSVPSRASGRLVVVPRPQTDPTRPSPPALALYPVHVHSKNGAKSPRQSESRDSAAVPCARACACRRDTTCPGDEIPFPSQPSRCTLLQSERLSGTETGGPAGASGSPRHQGRVAQPRRERRACAARGAGVTTARVLTTDARRALIGVFPHIDRRFSTHHLLL
jgi:hypothetical protein